MNENGRTTWHSSCSRAPLYVFAVYEVLGRTLNKTISDPALNFAYKGLNDAFLAMLSSSAYELLSLKNDNNSKRHFTWNDVADIYRQIQKQTQYHTQPNGSRSDQTDCDYYVDAIWSPTGEEIRMPFRYN